MPNSVQLRQVAQTAPAHAGSSFSIARNSATDTRDAGQRLLFGNLSKLGFQFCWHEFKTETEADWLPAIDSGGLELCLNLDGQGTLADGRKSVELRPCSSVFYVQGRPTLAARRSAKEHHRFVTVGFTAEFLQQYLHREKRHLYPGVQQMISQTFAESMVSRPEPIEIGLVQVVESLRRCPVCKPAQETWYRCKALELAAQSLFSNPQCDCACTRRQRAACERARRVRDVLSSRLADPPSLAELGRLVGCSPCYLSRQFVTATGMTIQQFLRQARLERASELLRSGKCNVTEAALEVGYNSLSHFTVAFREAFGCCPGLYPIKTGF